MKTYYRILQTTLAVLLLLFIATEKAGAQGVTTRSPQRDSTVTALSDGGSEVEYCIQPFDFGEIKHPSESERLPLVFSEEEKQAFAEKRIAALEASVSNMKSAPKRSVNLSDYSVGEIPLQEGVTPTGGKTYRIPIAAASGFNLTPSVALAYNSQASDGWAGYGWDIQGVSHITLISKNVYYHGSAKGANAFSTDAVFALDGNPLVVNTQSETLSAFPLITATGNILVAPSYNSRGYAVTFTVKYPDGRTASFGIGHDVGYNKTSYPITEVTDLDGNRITFHYSPDPTNGNDRITAIRFGYNRSNQYKGEISFSYTGNSGHVTRYYAGRSLYKIVRLTEITSKDKGNILCRYSLSYEQSDNVWLLTQVDCSSDGEFLRPLVFEYGALDSNPPQADYLYQNHSLQLSTVFSPYDVDFVYRRGKFVPGSYNDGLLIYPDFDVYDVTYEYKPLFGSWIYKFGSPYPSDQVCLFAPSLEDFNDVDGSITAGNGFQTIEAVDVDGDGLDEIVKLNFNGVSGSNTRLLITVYKCNTLGVPVQNSQFEILLQGTVTSGGYVSPYRRAYFWGDFCGNGRAQLLTVAYDKNYNSASNISQNPYAALIDLYSQTKLCDSELFSFPISRRGCLLPYDLDNDGQTEIGLATPSGFDVYRFASNAFTIERTLSTPTSLVMTDQSHPYHISDINGDGYIDIMLAPAAGTSTDWTRYAYDGNNFNTSTVSLTSRTADDAFLFIDINQDGLSDLVKISGTTLGTYMNLNGATFGSYLQSPSAISDAKGIIPANIVNRSGTSCFMKVDSCYVHTYAYTSPSPAQRNLTKFEDSMGRVFINSYGYLPSMSRYWTDSSIYVNNVEGYAFRTLPIYVLEGEDAFLDDSCTDRYRRRYHNYFNGVVHSLGLGFCGFSKARTYDNTGDVTEIAEEVRDAQKFGVVTSVTSRHGSVWTDAYFSLTNTWDNNSTAYGKLNPRLTESIAADALTGINTTTTYTYGSYDLPSSILVSRRIGTGTAETERINRTYCHSVSASKYILGAVTEESVIRDADGDPALKWKEKSVNTYDDRFRPIVSKKYVGKYGRYLDPPTPFPDTLGLRLIPFGTFYDATYLVSETQWQYDSLGNVLSEKSAPYGANEYVGNTFTYDNDGRYLVAETDALGHMTILSGYNKFGKPSVSLDYRYRTTSYAYDAWGNLTAATSPDGTVEQTTASWGGSGLYTILKTVTGRPETVTHYDALGREIRSGVKRFDGQWQWTDREYDSKGRLSRVSLPYRGNTASYWNTYAYDEYNRPVSLTEASGKTSTWSYSGTSITTVKDGTTSTSTTDANGNVISVADAGGTITYVLRDDGQPSSVTAPGNVTTTFTYDDYGRRIMVEDPSDGTHTDAYLWNADGSSQVTHTSPRGTVTTSRDKYGRISLVERPGEFNTSYTYNNYGLLTTAQSTNGTGMEYTYDSLDRISTVAETAPDGKWLQKEYSYGTGSILNSISYISQSGTITTESYSYANGHNTGIALPDGTVIWSLTSENDLGMATAITSGTITREYGFTAFGMPTFRRMDGGDLQNFTYQIDVTTDNLLSRSDGVNGRSETFGYDSLNRLVSIGGRQISYAANGNILSIGGVGTMTYGTSTSNPYQVTSFIPEANSIATDRQYSITYTGFDRPAALSEGNASAAFTYNGDGDRVKMSVSDSTGTVLSRYYIGGRYEYDQSPSGTKERLYLGGDAYSAPMVLQRVNAGAWVAYNIGRDYLGSITHIATSGGTPVAEYSYDPWGRPRNPETLAIYPAGSEPELFLGRGFTGHEHLTWFGLVNMNARLYDPLLGRFLSPDPYVQAPDFSQNFNRYSYALNNPLRYTDESGEFFFSLFMGPFGAVLDAACWGAVIGGASYTTGVALSDGGFNNWSWSDFGKSVGFGALSGAVTFGVGEAFSAFGNFAGTYGTELIRGIVHGLTQGGLSSLQGGDFWSGFASGTLGSWAASGYSILGLEQILGNAGMLVFSSVAGGISSEINGGDFWKGACIGLVTASFNHLQHKTEEYKFFERLRRHYSKGNGEDFIITGKEFNYLVSKGKIDYAKAKLGEDGYYTASIDFYDAGFDLKYSFGKATVKFYSKGMHTKLLGFYDRYDFDAKSWGERSIPAELITRGYGGIVSGTSFDIFYRRSIFVK